MLIIGFSSCTRSPEKEAPEGLVTVAPKRGPAQIRRPDFFSSGDDVEDDLDDFDISSAICESLTCKLGKSTI